MKKNKNKVNKKITKMHFDVKKINVKAIAQNKRARKIAFTVFHHKGYLFLVILFLVLIIVFFRFFAFLFQSSIEDAVGTQFDNSSQVDQNWGQNDNFAFTLRNDFYQSQESNVSGKVWYFYIGIAGSRDVRFFKDIKQNEWRNFTFFNLRGSWYRRWQNDGPMDNIIRNGQSEAVNSRPELSYILLNQSDSDYSTQLSTCTTFIRQLTTPVTSADGDYNVYRLGNTEIPEQSVKQQVLTSSSNGGERTVTNSTGTNNIYTDILTSPFILKISNGTMYVLNATATQSQITSLG